MLDDGSILVTGGVSQSLAAIDQAELLDPADLRSTAIVERHLPRTGHVCVKLADGRVVLVGGATASGEPEGRIEVFDPRSGTFSIVASLATARVKHGAALLADGTILVVGGADEHGNALDTAELIDPAAQKVVTLGATMSVPRQDVQATSLADGNVLVTSGSSAEIHDATGKFLPPFEMSERRVVHTATRLDDGRVLTFANGVGEVFSPPNRMTRVPGTGGPAIRDGHTATSMRDGRVLIVGGGVPEFGDELLGAPVIYDPRSNAYEVLASDAALDRANHTASSTRGGKVVIIGGRTLGAEATDEVYAYDPATTQ